MNIKKSISAILAASIVTVLAAGCGNANESSKSDDTSKASTTTAAGAAVTTEAQQATDEKLSGTLTMNGSTSMKNVAGAVNAAFMEKYPDVTIDLKLDGSGTGIKDAMAGTADIGNASRDLKDTETGLVATVVGIDGIAIIVHSGAGIDDISLEDLRKVYLGEIKNWSELGGADEQIVPIGREDGSGTRDGFESIVLTGDDDKAAYAQELSSTGSVISTVSTTAGAIGYASLASVDESVVTLKVNGVEPTKATVQDKSYPVQRNFNCVIQEGNENPLVKAYLEFILSDEGQALVEKQGAISVK